MKSLEMQKYKMLLEKEKEALLLQLNALKGDKLRKKGPISADFQEQAQEVENDEVVDGLEVIESNKLESIEAALVRIETGSFGTCAVCNDKIPESRLEAVPFAINCAGCSK